MSRVRILGKDRSCCGVLKQGWEGYVKIELDMSEFDWDMEVPDSILVLDDNTLVWKSQTTEIPDVNN